MRFNESYKIAIWAIAFSVVFFLAGASHATLKLCANDNYDPSAFDIFLNFSGQNNNFSTPTSFDNNTIRASFDTNASSAGYGVNIYWDPIGVQPLDHYAPALFDKPSTGFVPLAGGCIGSTFNPMDIPEPWGPNFTKAVCEISSVITFTVDLTGQNVPTNYDTDLTAMMLLFRDHTDTLQDFDVYQLRNLQPIANMTATEFDSISKFFDLSPGGSGFANDPNRTWIRGVAAVPLNVDSVADLATGTFSLDLEEKVNYPSGNETGPYKLFTYVEVPSAGPSNNKCYSVSSPTTVYLDP